MPTNVIVPAPYDSWLTLKEAAEALGYQPQYTRTLVKDGKIGPYASQEADGTVVGARVKLDMGAYQQWRVNPTAIEHYKANVGTSGFGGGNVRRYTIRFNPNELNADQIAKILLDNLGEPGTEGEDNWRYEFAPAWDGTKKKKSSKKASTKEPETIVASIVASLTETEDDEDIDTDEDFPIEDDPLT